MKMLSSPEMLMAVSAVCGAVWILIGLTRQEGLSLLVGVVWLMGAVKWGRAYRTHKNEEETEHE